MRQGSRTLCEVPTGRLTALDGVQRGPRETSPVQGAPTHAGRKGPLCNSPLSLCRWPGVPSPSRLRPAFDERGHPERGVHHLPPRGAKPEAAGVLRHDHGRGRLDRKSPRCPRRTHTSRASGPAGPHPWMHASRPSASSGPHMSLRQAALHCPRGPCSVLGLAGQREEWHVEAAVARPGEDAPSMRAAHAGGCWRRERWLR